MNLRLAVLNDLPQLKDMYKKIIIKMNESEIKIWDDIYPCEFFKDDINNCTFYVLSDESGNILGAFNLQNSKAYEINAAWENKEASAAYIKRLGVNSDFTNQGIGTSLLNYAAELAKQQSAEYLRLLVADINTPAINLYLKNQFSQITGTYVETIDKDIYFNEYAFEKKL